MSEAIRQVLPTSLEDKDTARLGYQTAVGLSMFYAQMVWAIFNAMVVANSIVVTAIILLGTHPGAVRGSIIFLGGAGLALCFAWLTLSIRAHEYAAYYVLAARQLEESHLAPLLQVLTTGHRLSRGAEIKMHTPGKPTTMRFTPIARLTTGQLSSKIVIAIFACIYCFLIWNGCK